MKSNSDSLLSGSTDKEEDLRQRGNFEFSQGHYDNAVAFYSAALEVTPTDDRESLIRNYCNRAACFHQMQAYERAKQDAETAWSLSNRTSVKAAFRLAKACLSLREFEEAKNVLQRALLSLAETPTSDVEQQRQSLHDLWQKVVAAALEPPPPIETSIKYVSRPISIREFTKGKELGYGNFSEILIVTHNKTKESFALKRINKKQAADLAKRQHPNVYNEIEMERRALLERLPSHPFIIRMYHAFQDYEHLYYLMELHSEWGDLWSELRSPHSKVMVGCHRSQAKVWLYQLLDAMEHMHKYGIVHRDLKPENILLNHKGHVIVIDFGTAKDLIHVDLNGPEFVGTPDFMSPEAVNGTSGMEEAAEAVRQGQIGAIHTADLYTFGAIAYILQTGMTPYWSPSPYLAFLRIKRGLLTRSIGIVDDDCWDLISSLMALDPVRRLGADAFCVVVQSGVRRIEMQQGGYAMIRRHPYFADVDGNSQSLMVTPIPSLQDLCFRAVGEMVQHDALDVDVLDQHPPGDGSSHDLLRLGSRERAAVLHYLDRQKRLRDPRIYARFFADKVSSKLEKVRPQTRDFVGLTQMNDDQGKAPRALMNDPYAEPIKTGPITFVQICNPLLVKEVNEVCNEESRKIYIKQLKRCIASVNKSRPKMVVAAGFIDDQCRTLLARISESIPTIVHDGSAFFTFWCMGVQCIALQSKATDQSSDQAAWIREQLELCRMSKHPLFCFFDKDPRSIPLRLQKQLARGRTLCILGPSLETFKDIIYYEANEVIDDASIKSTDSIEDEKDEFSSKIEGTLENGLKIIQVEEEPDTWRVDFLAIELN